MPERPLLLFPNPEVADRSKRPGFASRVHRPDHRRQGQRLSPVFTQLQEAFDARRVEVQQNVAGTDPEQVLVIETIGGVENFANAVKKIGGLEWMGELEVDDILPDDDFFDEKDAAKALSGRLYLVMSNQRALEELLSLWRRYQADSEMRFDRGLSRFRDVFLRLKDIRRWDVQDRIEETGVLEAWRQDLEHAPDNPLKFEMELWFRGSHQKRQEAHDEVSRLAEELGGSILADCVIADIAYHALLAQIPSNAAQQIIEHPAVDLIKCDGIMFIRPVGQMATGKRTLESELSDHDDETGDLPRGDPVVAILDGLPLANHRLLQDRLIIDDPDDYAAEYEVQDRSHGTAMASLLVHGDLNDGSPPLARPVYVRPIMKPVPWSDSPRPEQIPDDVLVVDHIHRAIRRMFEGEGRAEASAPTVRIVNFSLGDPSRQFTQMLSPLARLLDWLSLKYSVLIVISTGNHAADIATGLSRDEFNALSDEDKEASAVKALYQEARNRRILSPSESINGITVGSLHHDAAGNGGRGHAIDLFTNRLPSPISAFGTGYRRAIKPDLVFAGGRVLYTESVRTPDAATFECRLLRMPPGIKVASPSPTPGELTKVVHSCGSSNATAMISRLASGCLDTLIEILEEQAPDVESDAHLAPLLKSMIIHGCSWGEIEDRLRAILQTPENGRQIRNWITRWIGYGVPVVDRVAACTGQRATILGFGSLSDEQAHLFRLPLPPSLAARRDWRRLTATLAWLSPVSPSTQRYRTASLWFEVEGASLAPTRQNVDWTTARRGTVQHEVFEGTQAMPIRDGDALTLKVNCRKDAGKIEGAVPYGLAVTLEVAEGIDIAIYDEIRTRIVTAVPIRASEAL